MAEPEGPSHVCCQLCFVFNKLIECGNVESNPGPSVEDMLELLMNGQKEIITKITELKQQQAKKTKVLQASQITCNH